MLKEYGFLRVGALVNEIHLCDPIWNAKEIIKKFKEAEELGVEIITTPELALTGYTAQDMFLNDDLYNGVLKALEMLKEYSSLTSLVFIVGAPIRIKNSLYNCALSFYNGHIIGITPKTFIPNYNEFYEARWFTSANELALNEIELLGDKVYISNKLCYKCDNYDLTYAIDICEDLWVSNTPSNFTSLNGATLIFNLSSSNETIGKVNYRRNLVKMQSSKTLSAYVYASSGISESTSDILFSGHAMIAEPDGTFVENEQVNNTGTVNEYYVLKCTEYAKGYVNETNYINILISDFETTDLGDEIINYMNGTSKDISGVKGYLYSDDTGYTYSYAKDNKVISIQSDNEELIAPVIA